MAVSVSGLISEVERKSWTGRALDVRHDALDAGVVLEPVQAQVPAVAGVLEAAVGHLGDQGDVGVDPDAGKVEGARAE
jgi:hypothetical protein